jgi:magnesium-transporting ATPase (P-type)
MEMDYDCYETLRKKADNILEIIPFNSKRKRACCVIRHPND